MRGWPFSEKPLLVFWETTKACMLACKHCRAEAILHALPGELTTEEGMKLIDDIASFGKPTPILVFTGGDPLMRKDFWDLLEYALDQGVRASVAPSVTPLLTSEAISRMARTGVRMVSLSLDSPYPHVHDAVRGVPGTWQRTLWAVREFHKNGVRVQINTVVMRDTVEGLADMVPLLKRLGVKVWEVFYHIPVGRAGREGDLTAAEYEDVGNFLYEASKYGIMIRTVEGPSFRRIALVRRLIEEEGYEPPTEYPRPGRLYERLSSRLRELLGEPEGPPLAHTTGTMDGRGIVFISHNGNVYPSGFLPLSAGNIRHRSLVSIYRKSLLFRTIRDKIKGRCGACEFRDICGGSRARAYAYTGDPYAEDPACPYKPGTMPVALVRRAVRQHASRPASHPPH